MKVALCFSPVGILYVSGLPTVLDQIAVLACPLQAKPGTESPQAGGKLSCEITFSKISEKVYAGMHYKSEKTVYFKHYYYNIKSPFFDIYSPVK